MAVCDHGQLNRLSRKRQGRLPRTRGALKAFGAGLGCLWLRGIPSAEFLHAGPSAAQPAPERLQSRRAMLQIGVFLTTVGGGTGHIVPTYPLPSNFIQVTGTVINFALSVLF